MPNAHIRAESPAAVCHFYLIVAQDSFAHKDVHESTSTSTPTPAPTSTPTLAPRPAPAPTLTTTQYRISISQENRAIGLN